MRALIQINQGLDFSQLYVNNQRAIRSRQPNTGNYYEMVGWGLKGRNLIMKENTISQWENFEKVEAVIQMFWVESYVHLKDFEKIGGAIYTLLLQPGTKIMENYIEKIQRSSTAGAWPIAHLYLDEKSGGTVEKPMVMERNCMRRMDSSVKSWNLHREGIVLLINNSVYPIPDVVKKVGIEEEYKEVIADLLKE